jgi:hypothetical protein
MVRRDSFLLRSASNSAVALRSLINLIAVPIGHLSEIDLNLTAPFDRLVNIAQVLSYPEQSSTAFIWCQARAPARHAFVADVLCRSL